MTIRGKLAVLTLLVSSVPAAAAEPWADPKLPVKDGLVVWLDASRLADGRKALTLPPVMDGAPVDLWPDASGHKRHVAQKDAKARPAYRPTGDFHAVRFPGRDAQLRFSTTGLSFPAVTVFVVAAPYSQAEWFSGFLAMSEGGKNDYLTGLNVDQGTDPPQRFSCVNVEGAGSAGLRNLLQGGFDYGTVVRLGVTFAPGKDGVALSVNGKPHGRRDRADSAVKMDEFVVGARYYTNGGPPEVRGFYDGDLAEVIVYDRALSDADRTAVEKYLADKYAAVVKLPVPAARGTPLVRLADPPPVQVFVPGFSVRRLPVDLTNVNNVLYRADGKLVALAYNGDVYLLSDTDGDGLEDKATVFWENKGRLRGPIGMALAPPGFRHGQGVFVASKGKVSLLVDADGDDKADKEVIVADGWKELPVAVDAVGVAVHPTDGSVYFGRGTQDYSDAYGLKKGAAPYDLGGERGTILRVAPDFKSRETVATGIRFPVGIRFNAAGDLFCTDQEGATWLANGNPFDELLHVQKGRHYGFPPRHPKHLPGVIDEPSVFDYGPQHQSTCGLNFNEPVNGGPSFGPGWWRSDAFVAGYSRGKLYQTQLVPTPAGYVARNRIFAGLSMLTADVCVSPKGDLVVACHSGGPDWGSGPTGKGALYKIAYTGTTLPQPVLAWPQSPREVRIAFDRPLEADHLAGLKASIESGKYVSAGDRFESLWPGYKVVQDQLRAPRFAVPVHSVGVTADRRTLILATAPHPEAVSYAATLTGLGRGTKPGELRQVPETDLQYDLSGVEAVWRPKTGDGWSGWLPHLDLSAARMLTLPSANHETFRQRTQQPGELTLRTTLDLRDMLRPAVQPGSKIDYEWPAEKVTLTFRSRSAFTVQKAAATKGADGYSVTISPAAAARVPVEVVLTTGGGEADLRVTWHTAEDGRPRALPLRRLLVPWAPAERIESPPTAATDAPELKGGNWARGRKVFLSEEAACSKCHRFGGEGAVVGPDLSNLPHRDYPSVLRDVAEPSFAINPDYISQVVNLADGRVLTGPIRVEGESFLIGDEKGQVATVRRADVDRMVPSKVSVMPEGLPKLLGPEKMRDLLTYLLTEPPRLTDYGRGKPPEPRSRKEVEAVLAGAVGGKVRPLTVVLVAGKKDHGPGEHDYPAWQKAWVRLLRMAEGTTVDTADDWPTAEQLKTADVLVFYQQGKWTAERAKDLDAFLARGGGAVYIHWAVEGGADGPGFAQRIGLASQGPKGTKFRHGPLDLGFETGKGHPIARNFDRLHLHDESYWQMTGDPKRLTVLATGKEEGKDWPLFWTLEPAKGRVFVSIPGHFSWTFDDPLFRVLLLRGIAWAGREPVDRFNELVWPGARVKE
jgi:putative heme-binding domain-containing protein